MFAESFERVSSNSLENFFSLGRELAGSSVGPLLPFPQLLLYRLAGLLFFLQLSPLSSSLVFFPPIQILPFPLSSFLLAPTGALVAIVATSS